MIVELRISELWAPPQPDQLDVVRDPATGRPIPSATTPGSYDPRFISTATGAITANTFSGGSLA